MEEELIFRLFFVAVFALVLSLSAYYRGLARKSGEVISRRQEGTLALILRAAMTFPLLLAILLYVFLPGWSARRHSDGGSETDRGLRRRV